MAYHQITREERYTIWALRRHEKSMAEIARTLGRHRSTIHREVRRNCGRADGFYRPLQAHSYARTRRSHSRRNFRLTAPDWHMVEVLLMKEDWSPEQIAGRLDLEGRLQICHETIYRHVWNDKRHGTYDSRGRLAGKRPIEQRPAAADNRSRVGHWEADTMLGDGKPCVVTLVERKTGYLEIGKLNARTSQQLSRRTTQLIQRHRSKAQPKTTKTTWIPNTTGVLPSLTVALQS